MRVVVFKDLLYLVPEGDIDNLVLSQIVDAYETHGFSRTREPNDPVECFSHVSIQLKPLGQSAEPKQTL